MHSILTDSKNDLLFSKLLSLYPTADAGAVRHRWQTLADGYAATFGPAERAMLFSTPGRTEIGGNHTDHQHGCVLAGSVDLDIIAVAAPNDDGVIRIASEGFPALEIPLADEFVPNEREFTDSRALVKGIVQQFRGRGHTVRGFNACLQSQVLRGSGLSSSAAYEVMIGNIINHLFAGGLVSPVDLAIIGRYAENHFFGKPCGLMDQLACAVGGVLAIDFCDINSPAITQVAFDLRAHGHALCIIDSGADHAAMTDEYSPIPAEMQAVAACFGAGFLREVDKAAFLRDIPKIRETVGDRALIRALHFFADSQRTGAEAAALAAGDIATFLKLVNASGRSSCMYLQNVYPFGSTREQAVGLALALADEFLAGRGAFRVHGGGFAGTLQAFVPLDMLAGFKKNMEAVLGQGSCLVLSIRQSGAVRVG